MMNTNLYSPNTTTNTATILKTEVDKNDYPSLISAKELGESAEFIYKQNGVVWKVILKVENGVWTRKEVYGKIIPAHEERYVFDNDENNEQ